MEFFPIAISTLLVHFLIIGAQHVPPGVHPQHYQQGMQPPMQHQQGMQPPMQHQQGMQPPMQHQQVPMHQVPQHQVHVPQQQAHVPQQQAHVPQQQAHIPQQHAQGGHHQPQLGPGGQHQVLNVANIAQEKEHIAEHLHVPIDTSKMSEQELQFHYFKMHDSDNNNKLDGCELIKSLIHWHEVSGQGTQEHGKPQVPEKIFRDEELANLIDPILAMDDGNFDGFIDYPEFVRAQQKAAASHPPPSPTANRR